MPRSNPDALNAPFRKKGDQEEVKEQICEWPGCQAKGGYRAPKNRDKLREYHSFCLEHVQQYNKNWNFFSGMSDHQMEDALRADMTWQRPTWKVGTASASKKTANPKFKDSFGFWSQQFRDAMNEDYQDLKKPLTPKLRQALSVFNLSAPVSAEEVKATFKKLAKKHHPDLNQGDEKAAEKFKRINEAYGLLKEGVE